MERTVMIANIPLFLEIDQMIKTAFGELFGYLKN